MSQISKILFVLFVMAFPPVLLADNVMQISSAQIGANDTVIVDVVINNDSTFYAFQLDIPLPAQLSLLPASVLYNQSRTNSNHNLSVTLLEGDTLRIFGYSDINEAFIGNSGAIVSFKLIAGDIPGDYLLSLIDPVIGGIQQNNLITASTNGMVTILGPDIRMNITSIDFGETPLLSHSDRSFIIYNDGNQDLRIDSIKIDQLDFEVLSNDNFILSAGGYQFIDIRFNSLTKGDYEQILSIYNSDPDESIKTIDLSANAFAVNEIHTGTFTAFSGDTARLSFSINNMEAFTAFQFDLSLPQVLTYIGNSAALKRNTNHQVTASMIDNNTLRVVAYSASNDEFSGSGGEALSLDFYVFGSGGYYLLNLMNPVLSGPGGQNSLSDHFNSQITIAAPDIFLSTSVLSYGDVSLLESSTRNFTIYNGGQDTLTINQLISSNPCFTTEQDVPFDILPNENRQVEIKFTPAADVAYTESILIKNNDPDEQNKTINLNADAYAPNFLSIQDTYGAPGDVVEVHLTAENIEEFTAFQCDITFPQELSCVIDSVKLAGRAADHAISKNIVDNNSVRLIAYSAAQNNFSDSSGTIAVLPFTIAENAVFPISLQISNAVMGNAQSENILRDVNNGEITYLAHAGLDLKVFLEGPFENGSMNNTLNSTGFLPLNQPYNTAPWNYTGSESVAGIPNDSIVDWVLVELRETDGDSATATSDKSVWRKAAFLLSNGQVTDTSGADSLSFQFPVTGNLYAIIYHRNHLGIMSATPLVNINGCYSYDFTNDVDKVYGSINGHKEIAPGVFGMVAGDGDGNGQVQNQDLNEVWKIQATMSGYMKGDFDLNAEVQTQDRNDIWIENATIGSQIEIGKKQKKCGYISQVPK